MSQPGKLMPNLDQQSTKVLNLTVLQRMDPFIEEILITAAHVTFYEFNIDSSQWGRKDVEGSLFVVKSEFEELEAVPNISVIEGPLEPSSTAIVATEVPEDVSFENFFSAAANIGNSAPIMANSRQNYHSSTAPLIANANVAVTSASLAPQMLPLSLSSISSSKPVHGIPDSISSSDRVASLVKPSLFSVLPSTSSSLMVPPSVSSSSLPPAVAANPPINMQQRPYGTPMLQPFPPPNPPPSLTPTAAATPLINRDKVRDALLKLVQDDQFIDMFYQALTKVHHT
ncbi:unnamed protein product [Linum tenue]|uniref:mRNA-decapping enzyme-like protein n=1 Tax=Linum tenue TaxID=586396 RepID=A0AAV0I159_9ROSI|nr:unnamed protein product [Linum tenue]